MAGMARASTSVSTSAGPRSGPLGPAAVAVCARPAARRPPLATCATSSEANTTLDDQAIEGLSRDYCDEFVCNSSPAVESTVRALARDITRANGVWTKSLLSRNVEYQETFRRFKGPGGYRRLDFVPKRMTKPEATVTSMRMADGSTGVISWRLRGNVGPFPVDVDMETTIQMNLLTGQIERQTERWSLSRCAPPAAAAWALARTAWAVASAGADAADATNGLLESLASVDDDSQQPGYSADPNDPTKFFQQRDGFKDDAINFLAGVALLYAVVQAYTTIFTS